MNKKVEVAHSYFQLAIVLSTIAGFLIIAYSVNMQIALSNANVVNNLKLNLNSTEFLNSFNNKEVVWDYIMMTGKWVIISKIFLWLSIIFGICALLSWIKGRKILDKT